MPYLCIELIEHRGEAVRIKVTKPRLVEALMNK